MATVRRPKPIRYFIGVFIHRAGAAISAFLNHRKPDFNLQICIVDVLKATELGNLEDLVEFVQRDNSILSLSDEKGCTAAHQAAAHNRVNILEFISNEQGDLNAQDADGKTPIQIAVENDSYDAIDFLLSKYVNTEILNGKTQAVIHLATQLNKVKALQIMWKYRHMIHVNQPGEQGRTALHIAAIYDHEECARILLSDFGANPRILCDNGHYPLNEAARNASSKTMFLLYQGQFERAMSAS